MPRDGTARAFIPLTHVKSPFKTLFRKKTYYWQMLIILFVDDRAKQTSPLCESGKEKFISGAADFGTAAQHGAVMAFITDHNN